MPELPEVETTRRGIEPWLVAQHVTSVTVRQRQLRWPIPHNLSSIVNQPINSVGRRGKYLLIDTGKTVTLIHLGMSGSLRLCQPELPLKTHDHVIFALSNQFELRYHDPRRFGCVLTTQEPISQHPLLASLGPEPLENEFDGALLHRLSRKRKQAIKNFIMDSKTVVGVGNIYASESLFAAGIRPGIAAGSVSRARYERLAIEIKQVLKRSIDMGGTTLRDFVNSEGEPGYFAQNLSVYGRANEPCHVCHTTVKSVILGQRSSFYCPACQR